MPDVRTIPVGNLLLDLSNPRLAQGPNSQREALHSVLRAEGKKTLELAKNISERGLNPSERLMVIPSTDDAQRFVVLDGNRRLTALRLLGDPKLNGEGVLKGPTLKRAESWSRDYQKHPTANAECVVFANRAEANPWIKLRHVGESEGAGLVRWGAIEQMRFDSRENGVLYPELQILDFVAEHADLDDETRDKLHDFPITNLQRLVDDADFRSRLGVVDVDSKKRVKTKVPDSELAKGWGKVVRDLASGSVKVGQIYTAKERKAYLNQFKKNELPDLSKGATAARVLTPASSKNGAAATGGKKAGGRIAPLRKTMASTKCRLEITNPKIAKIYRELQTLSIENYQNACAVLFRVFLELTTDHYVEKQGIKLDKGQWESLGTKLSVVAGDLKKRGVLTDDEVKSLQQAAREKNVVGANIVTFHAYVHNKHFAPIPSDLRTYWDNLQHFFEKVWAK